MAGGSSTPAEKVARPEQMAALVATAAVELSATEQKDVQKRDAILAAVMYGVREEICIIFDAMDVPPNDQGVSIEKFLGSGTTLIARSPIDTDGPARLLEYVVSNRAISKKGQEISMANKEDGQGNMERDQSPLDIYMAGMRDLLKNILRKVELKDFGKFEVKVVATDYAGVDELKGTHIVIHEKLATFTPPKASSRGKE